MANLKPFYENVNKIARSESPETAEEKRYPKKLHERHVETVLEKNMYIKAAMVTELVQMGYSLELIEKILKVDADTLDSLL